MVTLLLGMSGEVVQAIKAVENEAIYYGVVVSSTKGASTASTTSTSTASAQSTTQVACTDGVVRTFYHSGTATAGKLVTVSTTQSGTTVKSLSTKRLSGTVSKDGTTFAGYDFASGVEILDTDDDGGYARIYPSRLAGAKLSGNDVRYYSLDASGDIDRLVLQNVTGDTQDYVYISRIENNSTKADDGSFSEINTSINYTYILNGQPQNLNSGEKYAVNTGGAVLVYDKSNIESIRQLKSAALDSVTSLSAMGNGKEYKLAENVQVLLWDGLSSGAYYLTKLSQINGEDYKLTGWYDDEDYSAGNRIRIIVAVPK